MLQKLPPNLAPSLAEAKGEAGVGETSIAVLLTADRLSAGLHLSEVMAKTFRSFKKTQKKIYPPLDGCSLRTKLPSSCLLVVIGLGIEKKIVSKMILFTQEGVMVLGQNLMGEVLWHV